MAKKLPSKPISISSVTANFADGENVDARYLYALCEDGTIWELPLGLAVGEWSEVGPYDHRGAREKRER